MPRITFAAAFTLCMSAAGLSAQNAGPHAEFRISGGSVARLTTSQDSARVMVTVLSPFSTTSTRLQFCTIGTEHCSGTDVTGVQSVARLDIRTLDVRKGTHAFRGLILGGVAGLVAGTLLASSQGGDNAGPVLAGSVLGLAVGGGVGFATGRESVVWKSVIDRL
jgi:hypothetical protein